MLTFIRKVFFFFSVVLGISAMLPMLQAIGWLSGCFYANYRKRRKCTNTCWRLSWERYPLSLIESWTHTQFCVKGDERAGEGIWRKLGGRQGIGFGIKTAINRGTWPTCSRKSGNIKANYKLVFSHINEDHMRPCKL